MNVSQETCRYFTVSDFRDEKGDGGIDYVHLKPSLKEVAVVFLLAMDRLSIKLRYFWNRWRSSRLAAEY